MITAPEIQQDLVFVGGGHTHALVLRMLAMQPIGGLRITLISPASHTPYSGMLPGLVAGHYSFEQAHIDLARLCQWAGVHFICAEASAIDPVGQTVSLHGRPSVAYDILSIDIGSQPELDCVPGARAYSIPVKPVADLWRRWNALGERLALSPTGQEHRIAMVGGGAGSVELIAAMAQHFSVSGVTAHYDLFCGGKEILSAYNRRARSSAEKALQSYGIALHLNARVAKVERSSLILDCGSTHHFEELFWCTGAAPASWLANSSLATDSKGFLAIDDSLRCPGYVNIFAAGDCATQIAQPRPKAGVYAVRQAPVLAANLRNALFARPLLNHNPQRRFLSLLSLGDKRATADRGSLSANGAWVWRWKDKIDREFMSRFEDLPALMGSGSTDILPGADVGEEQVQCGGCGAKVGADTLAAVLSDLAVEYPVHCPAGEGPQDAVLISIRPNTQIIQSLDTLRQIVADPWLMGRIAANHALSDLYACGAAPQSALASITLPFSTADLLRRQLQQVLSGALFEFSKVDCKLLGGHTMQGPELTVGFAVNGLLSEGEQGLVDKRELDVGDHLVLTKALGIGTLFAAHMKLKSDGRHIDSAVDMMLHSNSAAAKLGVEHGVSACTDVTGFGLAGHLIEMLAQGQSAQLYLGQVPALPGALDSIAAGIFSTMHQTNKHALMGSVDVTVNTSPNSELLYDPQTSGGLLFGIAPDRSAQLCEALVEAGYAQASVVGQVGSSAQDQPHRIVLR